MLSDVPWGQAEWDKCAESADGLIPIHGYWTPFIMARWYARKLMALMLGVRGNTRKARRMRKYPTAVNALRFMSEPIASSEPELYLHAELRIGTRMEWMTPIQRMRIMRDRKLAKEARKNGGRGDEAVPQEV